MFWGKFSTSQSAGNRLKQHPEAIEMSKGDMYCAALGSILRHDYGYHQSVEEGRAQDPAGKPLPMYTYPTLEYLQQLDFSDCRVFEYGAGLSSYFWAENAKAVVSAENNRQWFDTLSATRVANLTLRLAEGNSFPATISKEDGVFDIIIIDGAGFRFDCAVFGLQKLSDTGLIILDNADWHPNTAAYLRQHNLIQVDFTGFKPGEPHASTTSIFLTRNCQLKPKYNKQPVFGMGAKHIHSVDWDKPVVTASTGK